MAKLITITRKIELRINTDDKALKNDMYKKLKAWRDVACNGANMAISAMYTTLKGENISFLDKKLGAIRNRSFDFEDLEKKIQAEQSKKENKEIYAEINQEKKDFHQTSEVNYYYRMLAIYYKDQGIPTAILSCIANQVNADFINDKSDYLKHMQSLRTYKHKMPIPFTAQSIRNIRRFTIPGQEDKEYRDFCFNLFGVPLRTRFGRDRSNNYFLLKEAFSSEFLPSAIKEKQQDFSKLIMEQRDKGLLLQNDAGDPEKPVVFHLGSITLSLTWKTLSEKDEPDPKDHYYEALATYSQLQPDNTTTVTQHTFKLVPCQIAKQDAYKIASKYKFCDSKIQVAEEKYNESFGKKYEGTKLYLLASLSFEKEPWKLDPDKTAYCELDPEIPIKVTIGSRVINIGNSHEFKFRRQGIQGAYRETQRALQHTKGGRGRKRKLQGLDRFHQYEKDVVKLKIHEYSSKLIEICKENNVKTIYLRMPKKPETVETDEQKLLIRNWSYGMMDTRIFDKASRWNIDVFNETEKA